MQDIKQLINDPEVLFVISHSGGKDSQAMYGHVKGLVPKERILVLYADLKDVVWPGTVAHIKATIDEGTAFQSVTHSTGETLLTLATKKGAWPSPKFRSCTSQLKQGPLDKAIRHELKARGLKKIVSCIGIRSQESSARAKQVEFKLDARNSKAGREWYTWHPILAWSEKQVFEFIRNFMGQEPHWAYAKGMSRLSCCFCIMGSKSDLKTAAKLRPELFETYCKQEEAMGVTMLMPSKARPKPWLRDVVGGES